MWDIRGLPGWAPFWADQSLKYFSINVDLHVFLACVVGLDLLLQPVASWISQVICKKPVSQHDEIKVPVFGGGKYYVYLWVLWCSSLEVLQFEHWSNLVFKAGMDKMLPSADEIQECPRYHWSSSQWLILTGLGCHNDIKWHHSLLDGRCQCPIANTTKNTFLNSRVTFTDLLQ